MPPTSENVAIFWDYENCSIPANLTGYEVVNAIRLISQDYGSVNLFKAYLEVSEQVLSSRSLTLRSELQASGVSLTDCPHNGRKDVADKMMLVDMLSYAIDHPTPATFVLISGDRDFSYALSTLRLRRYRVVLITPPNTHISLTAQASVRLHWNSDVLDASMESSPKSPTKKEAARVNFSIATDFRKNTSASHGRDDGSKMKGDGGSVPATRYSTDPDSTLVMGEGSSKKRALSGRNRPEHRQHSSVPTIVVKETFKEDRGDAPTSFFGTPFKLPLQPLSTPRTPDSRLDSTTSAQYTDRKGKSRESSAPLSSQTAKVASHHRRDSSISQHVPDEYHDEEYQSESCCSSPPPSSELGGYDNDIPWEDENHPPTEPNSPRSRASGLGESDGGNSARSSSASPTKSMRQDGSHMSVPFRFKPLVKQLQQYRSKGIYIPQRSILSIDLGKRYKRVYQNAGVEDFGDYVALAEQEGFVTLGGGDGLNPWIMLRQEWVNITC
ncbi:NYN domain-containing protein [Ephemerocybe angulata]|uniref:NYN domain-containing protein n=1 Tax=Ephemerocybe angulata TaxID=980116 RepID=A0A8H6MFY3_9AGAR|nr:NYN domain-containing protein [Tulosesus angulatus]